MPERDWRFRVCDMLDFIERIRGYLAGVKEEDFLQSAVLMDAVARNLELIGEASTHVPEDVKLRHPHLPWSEMRGLRNVLAHGYMNVDFSIIWYTSRHRLGELEAQLRALLAAEGETS
jgi:uncharacterized protein with HEPN domain